MKMRTPLISIIVPVYNTSKFLKRCLDSLLNQTYKNIEIIIVDDGSTDDSPQICDAYASLDTRIIVVHQTNTGVVGARNRGIEHSSGDYVLFVDSDDWVSLDMCYNLVNKAETAKVDLVICDFSHIREDSVTSFHCEVIESPDILLHKIIRYQHPSVLWNKLFKRNLAISSLMNCVVGDNISEDFLAIVSCLLSSPTIAYVSDCLYFQNHDDRDSLTTNLPSLGKALYVGRDNLARVYHLLKINGVLDLYKSDFDRLVLNVKTYLLKERRFQEAKSFYPESHKDISTFNVIARPANWIYYGALNWGCIGIVLFKIYLLVINANK